RGTDPLPEADARFRRGRGILCLKNEIEDTSFPRCFVWWNRGRHFSRGDRRGVLECGDLRRFESFFWFCTEQQEGMKYTLREKNQPKRGRFPHPKPPRLPLLGQPRKRTSRPARRRAGRLAVLQRFRGRLLLLDDVLAGFLDGIEDGLDVWLLGAFLL